MNDLRLVRAQRILAGNGVGWAVSVAGFDDDILSIHAPIAQLDHLRALAPEFKQLGFRYVALELDTEDA